MNSLPRDGGEHPTHANGRRPMPYRRYRRADPRRAKVDGEVDGMGGLKVTPWPDDEEGGVVTFAPVKAVTS